MPVRLALLTGPLALVALCAAWQVPAAVATPSPDAVAGTGSPTGAAVRVENVTCPASSLRFVLRSTAGAGDAATPAATPAASADTPADIDPASLKVTVSTGRDRIPLEISGDESQRTATRTQRLNVVVALDASQSLEPRDFQLAKEAATAFVRGLPDGTRVGLVRIGSESQLVTAPTDNRDLLLTEIENLEQSHHTALYEAVVLSVRALRDQEGPRSILLMTDGSNDVRGRTPWADGRKALAELRTSGTTLHAVAFRGQTDRRALDRLAGVNGGEVLPVDQAERLREVFSGFASSMRTQVSVTAQLPPGISGSLTGLTVTGRVGGAPFTTDPLDPCPTTTPAPRPTSSVVALPPLPPPGPGVRLTTPLVLLVALGMVFLGSLSPSAVAVTRLTRGQRPEAQIIRRLSTYTLAGATPKKVSTEEQTSSPLGNSQLSRSVVDLVGRMISRGGFEAWLTVRLERAAVPLRPAEWMTLDLASATGAGLFLLLLGGGRALPTTAGLLLGAAVPWVVLRVRIQRRRQAFQTALADTLQMLASALRAGHALSQALNSLIAESRPPVSSEMSRAVMESRLGEPIEDALDRIAQRMESRDFEWVVMAIRIQRQVGGNLAELLTTVSGTLRERDRLRRQVRSLSAEGRLSAWILGLLPVALAGYLALVRPEYLGVLFSAPLGWFMVVASVVLLLIGALWLSKIVRVEV
jgi:tight adherence protein B